MTFRSFRIFDHTVGFADWCVATQAYLAPCCLAQAAFEWSESIIRPWVFALRAAIAWRVMTRQAIMPRTFRSLRIFDHTGGFADWHVALQASLAPAFQATLIALVGLEAPAAMWVHTTSSTFARGKLAVRAVVSRSVWRILVVDERALWYSHGWVRTDSTCGFAPETFWELTIVATPMVVVTPQGPILLDVLNSSHGCAFLQ